MVPGSAARYLVVAAVVAALTVLVVLPLAAVFIDSVSTGTGMARQFGLGSFARVLREPQYWRALQTTIVVSLGATVLATLIGVALAWSLVRTNIPFARTLERLATLPIFIPPFVGAFAWILLGAPRIGLANVGLRHLSLREIFDVYTVPGIIWVIGIYMAPYVMMIVASALRSMDPAMEEVGQVSGLNRWSVALRITLPVVAPAILSGAVLAFVIAIGLFGTPVLLGWSKQILTLTSRIYLESQQVPPAYGVMAVLALYLILLAGIAMFVQQRVLRGRQFITVTGRGFRPRRIALGHSRIGLFAAVCLYLALTVVVPVGVIVAASVSTFSWSGRLTTQNLVYLWTSSDVWDTLTNSLAIAVISATVGVGLGLAVAWVAIRTKVRGRRILEYVVLMPLSVPSIAFGIGVAALWLRAPIDIYATIWLIVLGFVGRFSGYAVRTISGSLVQVHPELEESARIGGMGPLRTIVSITMPLIRPSLVSSWLLLYSIFMTELSMVVILYSSNTRTFSILTFDFWYAGQFSRVSSLALLQLVVGVAVMSIVSWLSNARSSALEQA